MELVSKSIMTYSRKCKEGCPDKREDTCDQLRHPVSGRNVTITNCKHRDLERNAISDGI